MGEAAVFAGAVTVCCSAVVVDDGGAQRIPGIAADKDRVYISDAKSHVWAFDAESGRVDWRQSQLEARNITGPAIMGNYLVVGDAEGYLHWLNKQDGHFVARVQVNSSGIIAAPVVVNSILYVVTMDGHLAAYRV